MQNIRNIIVFLTRNYVSLIIRFDLLLVYAFSRTPLVLLWIVIIVLGFFAGEQTDRVNLCCLTAATYVFGTSLLVCIVLHSEITALVVEKLVGLSFVQRFAPKKGRDNLLIVLLPFFILLILEVVSLQYQVNSQLQESRNYLFIVEHLIETGQTDKAMEVYELRLESLNSVCKLKGIVSHFSAHPSMVFCHLLLSKVLGF